jgi:hypothetical protein
MLEIPNKEGGVGFRAIFCDNPHGASAPQQVGVFENMVGNIVEPERWQRGRDKSDLNYITYDPSSADEPPYNTQLIGQRMRNLGATVKRVIVFGPECVMTWHYDSQETYPEAKCFIKLYGSFSREGDDYMDAFTIQYSGARK